MTATHTAHPQPSAGERNRLGRRAQLLAGASVAYNVIEAIIAVSAGIAAGSWLAGHALDSSLGATGPALVGVAMTAVGLVSLLALVAVPATGTDVSDGSLPRPVAAAGAARPPMP